MIKKTKKITYKKLTPKKMAELIKILAWEIQKLKGMTNSDWYIDEVINRLYNR